LHWPTSNASPTRSTGSRSSFRSFKAQSRSGVRHRPARQGRERSGAG
jgi:hypothetical protein